MWSASWALKWSCLPLSPIVSGCLPLCGGWVLVGVAAFLGSEVVLSPVVCGCLPSCGGWVLVGVAASRTKRFRNQNHRFQSKFAYCKLFGVYAGVIQTILFDGSEIRPQTTFWVYKKTLVKTGLIKRSISTGAGFLRIEWWKTLLKRSSFPKMKGCPLKRDHFFPGSFIIQPFNFQRREMSSYHGSTQVPKTKV